jgi:hypothetical protein
MRTKTISVLLGGLSTLFVAIGPAQAAGFAQGKADLVEISGNSFAVIDVPGTVTPRVSCQTAGYNNEFTFDISTSKGKAMLSLAMAAYLSAKTVTVVGSGSCTAIGFATLETVSSLIVN